MSDESLDANFQPLNIDVTSSDLVDDEEGLLYRADSERMLRLLSAHQFDDPWLAFRELYANALDACRFRPEATIHVSVDPRRCVIRDEGAGFDEASIQALTTLGTSTRRGQDAVGRFGIGFVSVFDPQLGVARVEVNASRSDQPSGVCLCFHPMVGGSIRIERLDTRRPTFQGTSVEVHFDPARAPSERVQRILNLLSEHGVYSGTETRLNGRRLGRDMAEFIPDWLQHSRLSSAERQLASASAVRGAMGVAAVDPTRAESVFRVYQRGLFVCELPVSRPAGKPWIRGVYGAARADGLELVASRNQFVQDARFERFKEELRRLHQEASYRLVQYFESSRDPYARVILVDSIRRGLKSGTKEELLADAHDLYSSAVVRAPLFRAWGERRMYAFEELVDATRRDAFVAQSFRPLGFDGGTVFRAQDSIERDIFRRLSGMRDMPAVARAEPMAKPSWWSRIRDRLLSGPRAEYSLFQRAFAWEQVDPSIRELVGAAESFLAEPTVAGAVERLIPGPMPRLGFGYSRNAFGPVAAYRAGEIRFNVGHRSIRKLAALGTPQLGVRAMLPVLAHELAHMCHELHDLDFYRTSRLLLRTLVSAAAELDASDQRPTVEPEASWY